MTTELNSELQRLQAGAHHDPFQYLGWHDSETGKVLRVFMPQADQLETQDGQVFQRFEGTDAFELHLKAMPASPHIPLRWLEKKSQQWIEGYSPYTFAPQIGELDMHLFNEGKHLQAWRMFGAHLTEIEGVSGCQFVVWAPTALRVSVVGNFNDWDGLRHPMRSRGASGIWELFIPDMAAGEAYKFEILSRHNTIVRKTDPYAQQMFLRPETTSRVPEKNTYVWQDNTWIKNRVEGDWRHQPMSIYEVHAGSWRQHEDGSFYKWRELAETLIPYARELGYTHLELLPVSEHPLDQSWGYQVTGYYAPSARQGTPEDFRYFIDQCHQNNLGVILDWVPGHFPRDEFALARFIGEPLYEYADPRKGEHRDWGTLIFDYGRLEVKNFLLANALYWINEFHIDGLRVDAVASMLYLDYSRPSGQWVANQYGGRENLEAVEFLRELNKIVHWEYPGVVTIAEESTSWPAVSRPIEIGGLGFSMKWNMGWMNDNLRYISQDPIYRKYHHNQLTFSQMYAYSENFVLPLSHDEVVHMKRSMLGKMPGDYWQKFANLRLFYAWQYAHPGKKLLFMGSEFGQWLEWNENVELDWSLLKYPAHDSLRQLIGDLNRLYNTLPALYQFDFEPQGFRWIDCNDSEQSVLSLMRSSSTPGAEVIVILNFTPVVRHNYRIGIPQYADYREILNTDSGYYGGSNCGNAGKLAVQSKPWMGFSQSLEVTLPPLGAVFLQSVKAASEESLSTSPSSDSSEA